MKTVARFISGLLAAFTPLGTLLCAVGLLMLSVHVAAAPVAHLARVLLDLMDAGADWCGGQVVSLWAALFDWNNGRRDAAIEAFASYVDIPEKLAAVHAVGLSVELALLFAWFPVAWNVDPWELPWRRPDRLWQDFRAWFFMLPKWVKAERAILFPLLGCGLWTLSQQARTNAVALVASSSLLPADSLGTVGWVAAGAAAWLGLSCAIMPLMASTPAKAARAGRTRRLLVLGGNLLLVLAAVEAVLW